MCFFLGDLRFTQLFEAGRGKYLANVGFEDYPLSQNYR